MRRRWMVPLALVAMGLLWSLAAASQASAAACNFDGPGNDWHTAGNWSCGHVPTSGDDVSINPFDVVTVGANASAGSLAQDGGTVTFSDAATLAVSGAADIGEDLTAPQNGSVFWQGNGTLTVGGTFTKTGSGNLFVRNNGIGGTSADLVLNAPSVVEEGGICVALDDTSITDLPHLEINSTLTIEDGAAAQVFPCTPGVALIHVGTDGELVKAAAGEMTSLTPFDVDGTLTVQAGTLHLKGGANDHSGGATSDGDYIAEDGATLDFEEGHPPVIAGRLGGEGTMQVRALAVLDVSSTATIDPAVLRLATSGVINLFGSSPVTLPALEFNGGGFTPTLYSERPLSATQLNVTGGGAIQGPFTLTVPSGGGFSKTASGLFYVRNTGIQGVQSSADLVLNADATLDGGGICVDSSIFADPDLPNLQINQDFTIGAGADASAFPCGGVTPLVHVNGPDGHLLKTGPGTTTFAGAIEVAGGTFTVGTGQTFALGNGVALNGGVLRGAGQISGNVTNTSGTVRPGTSPGTLTVTGNYTQGSAGTLEIDVDGTAQGTQFDHLSVSGAAALAGRLFVHQGVGFDPVLSDAFQFLSSGSRTGAFSTLTGFALPGGKVYALEYPGGPGFGARLVATTPTDFVVTDCEDPALAQLTMVTGDLLAQNVPGCDVPLSFPNLTQVYGDIEISDNTSTGLVDLNSLTTASGTIDITGNTSTGTIDLNSLTTASGTIDLSGNTAAGTIELGGLAVVSGDINISDNGGGTPVVTLGSLTDVGGDMTVETEGTGTFDPGPVSPGGDTDLTTEGYDAVSATTAAGSTSVENVRGEATMTTQLPAGAFAAPVAFTITRNDPAALPPQQGAAAGGGAATIDPVAAYQFAFDVPTLNQDATLSFEVDVNGLDPATRTDFLAAIAAGTATLATRGDAPGGTYQASPLCTGSQTPTANGCVSVAKLDANGQPTSATPARVRFTGVTGHFSTWAVAIVQPQTTPAPPGSASPPSAKKCKKGLKKVKGKCRKKRKKR